MSDNMVYVGAGTQYTVGAKNVTNVFYPYHIIADSSGNLVGTDGSSNNELKVSIYGKGSAAGDAAIPSFDTAAHAGFIKVTDGTNTLPTGDAAARKIYVTLTNGTGTAAFDNANTTPKVSCYGLGTAAGDTAMPALDTAAHAGYMIITNGTQNLPTGDAAARKIFVTLTDGTGTAAFDNSNTTPKVSLYAKGSAAGNTSVLAGTAANLQTTSDAASLLVVNAGELTATDSIVTGTTTPTATLAAAGTGKIYTVKWITVTLACTADQVPLLFKLIQDTGGTPLTLWQGSLAGLAKTSQTISVKCNIPQTVANKALDLSVTAGTIVSTNYITVSFGATISA